MNLHLLRQPNAPIEQLIEKHGLAAVVEELDEMCYEDLADRALEAAVKIGAGARVTAGAAARIVLNSGAYSDEAKDLARKTLGL